MNCGLLGGKLGHSYSPQIHSDLGDYIYELYEKSPEELGSFLKHGAFTGLNVTIPYKKAVIPYCSELSDRARQLSAVNTLVRRPDGTLIGHNSDYFGFQYMLSRSGLQVAGKKVLVLGSGGASATAVAVLRESGANVVVISRTGADNYNNYSNHQDTAVVVNTTPVGMFPDVGVAPIDIGRLPNLEGVLDVIYNPARTQILMDAERLGLIAENGLWMLVAQAKESAEWFTGKNIDNSMIPVIHEKLQRQMQNIILIGMPGCGKSTVGKIICSMTGKPFVDADLVIAEKAGKSIPDIFNENGEVGFRALETQVLSELGKQSGLVIATGGGCVTKEANYPLLHQNGQIFWIHRDTSKLPTDGRPLSQDGRLEQMYAVRKPLYARFFDYSVDNNNTPETAAHTILSMEDNL